jgi:hypothetical protein
MAEWRDRYHTSGKLFIPRHTIVFAAQVDAQTFAWATALQPTGTIRYLVPKNIAYGTFAGSGPDVKRDMTILFGTAPGKDDLGRTRVLASPSTVVNGGSTDTIQLWVSNQGTSEGEINISTGDYITVIDEYRFWAKLPYVDTASNVYKDGLFPPPSSMPPAANAGPWYANDIFADLTQALLTEGGDTLTTEGGDALTTEGTDGTEGFVDFDASSSFSTEGGVPISAYNWDFADGDPATSTSATVNSVAFPPGFRWVRLQTSTASANNFAYVPVAVNALGGGTEGFITNFTITDHRMTRHGQRMAVVIHEDLPTGLSYFDTLQDDLLTAHYVLDEASGATATDNSGHRYDATIVNVSSYGQRGADGRLQAMGFDGTTDYVTNTDATFLADINGSAGAYSCMAQVSGSGVWTDGSLRYIAHITTSGNGSILVRKSTSNNTLTFFIRDTAGNSNQFDHTISTTDWFNITVTWDTTTGTAFYVDGVQVDSDATWGTLGTPTALFIGSTTAGASAWDGNLQHFALFDGGPSDLSAIGVPDLKLEWVLDGSLVMYYEREVFDRGTVGSLSSAGPSDREHMKIQGWMRDEPTRLEVNEAGTRQELEIQILDVGGRLEEAPGFPWILESDSAPPSTPGINSYVQINDLNIDRALFFFLNYDSTALNLSDFEWSGTGSNYDYPWIRIYQGAQYPQFDGLAQKIAHLLTVDKHGKLRMLPDPQLQADSDRPTTVKEALMPWDVGNIDYTDTRPPRHNKLWGNAVVSNSADAGTNPTISTVFCTAPGPASGQGAGETVYGEQVVQSAGSQAELNTREGNRYAVALNPDFSHFAVELIHTGDNGFDPADIDEWVRLAIPGTLAAQHGLTFPDPEYYQQIIDLHPDTLIGYWRLNDAANNTIKDWSGMDHDTLTAFLSGVTPRVRQSIGDGVRVAEFDGTGFAFWSPVSGDLAATIDFTELFLFAWIKVSDVSVWTDSTFRWVVSLGADSNNLVRMYKPAAANSFTWEYIAGGTTDSVTKTSITETGWICVGLSVSSSGDAMKAYWQGAQEGATQTGLGTFTGTLDSTPTITNGHFLWDGYGAHVGLFADPLSDADADTIATLDNRFLPFEMSIEYLPDELTKRITLLLEREQSGPAALTYTPPGG